MNGGAAGGSQTGCTTAAAARGGFGGLVAMIRQMRRAPGEAPHLSHAPRVFRGEKSGMGEKSGTGHLSLFRDAAHHRPFTSNFPIREKSLLDPRSFSADTASTTE